AWTEPGHYGAQYAFAVRVPQAAPVENFELSLLTDSAASNSLPITVVSPAPVLPQGPSAIGTSHSAAEDDGSFPRGSTTPFAGDDLTDSADFRYATWVYHLSFHGTRNSDTDAGVPEQQLDCSVGMFSGSEQYCPQAGCVKSEDADYCSCNYDGCLPE